MGKEKTRPERKLIAEPSETERMRRSGMGYGLRSLEGAISTDTLTPTQVRNYLLEAETGDLASQCELFEKMQQRDGELDAHLRTRRAGVSSLKWKIEPEDDSSEAGQVAEYVEGVINDIPDLQRAIDDLLDGIAKGLAILEIDWHTSKSEWRPGRLLYRPQRWFVVGEDGETLKLRDDKGAVEINPLNFIIHRVQARSGFTGTTSLMRSCVRAFVVRQYSWKDWMGFAEVYGMPPRIGRLREGVPWNSDEANQLYSALRAMGMDMSAAIRQGDEIEILDIAKAGEGVIFQNILEAASRELVLAILGQTLTSGGEKGGSYALGEVHNQVRWDLIESDALALDMTLTQQLVRPIVELNRGPNAPMPGWHSIVEQPEDLNALATRVKTLAEAGLPIPRIWCYDTFGIPEPAEGEEVLEPQPRGGGFPGASAGGARRVVASGRGSNAGAAGARTGVAGRAARGHAGGLGATQRGGQAAGVVRDGSGAGENREGG